MDKKISRSVKKTERASVSRQRLWLTALLMAFWLPISFQARADEAAQALEKAHDYQTVGVRDKLPVFYEQLSQRLTFPLSWNNWSRSHDQGFDAWRKIARGRVKKCFLTAPPEAPFDPEVIDTRKYDGYTAKKVVLNLTGDSRVLGYLVVPDGKGPFPAVLLLHDHGAEFRIGKEKVVEPWDETPAKMKLSREWVNLYYGKRYIGNELAKRGYVCFVVDALNWSDRGGAGYEGQQSLASNLMHLGMSLAGTIAQEDLRAAEFLASQEMVDNRRIAAMGLSMGSFRTWQVTAMSDHISAGAAICWMATVKGLMIPGNNQTRGQSAYTMLHPNLFNYLDHADVASIACPKPMLFYNGLQDHLFPVACVEDAYAKMHTVWKSQGAEDKLETKLWDVPHLFNREMQEEAFAWLDGALKEDQVFKSNSAAQ